MNGGIIPSVAALLVQVALGLAVFLANRRRLANQCFLLLSLTIDLWLAGLLLAFTTSSSTVAEVAIRQASVAGVLYPWVLNLLRLSVRQQLRGWRDLIRQSQVWLILTVAFVVL